MSEPFSRRTILLVLVAGILGPGLANYYLLQANYPLLSDVAYVLGYGGAVFLLWWGWFRHVELTG